MDDVLLLKRIAEEYRNTASLAVLKDGRLVYEKYFDGLCPDDKLHVFSVTKSVVALLVGIAIDHGFITGVRQKVLDFFPDYVPKRGEKTLQQVTLHDVLSMTVPYKYRSAPYTKYFGSPDWVKTSLDLMGGKGTIGEFRYAPLIGPDVLSGILVKATGMSVLDFAMKYLFGPLGITIDGSVVFHSKEEQMAWYRNRTSHGWVSDPCGVHTAGWGLSLSPRDMVKIGSLCLDGGRDIVSADWIAQCTTEQSRWKERNLPYGYLWWPLETDGAYAALGDGGNTIYVNPKARMVVAFTCRFDPRAKNRIGLIEEAILPSGCGRNKVEDEQPSVYVRS